LATHKLRGVTTPGRHECVLRLSRLPPSALQVATRLLRNRVALRARQRTTKRGTREQAGTLGGSVSNLTQDMGG
jgi:hypothetical protein